MFQESMKEMSVEELLALIATATAEAKKKLKGVKAPKETKVKKGSMEKGVLPPQLQESFAWVDYVLVDAKAHGWPAYAVKGKEELEAASEKRGELYVFPSGKEFNRKNAMSLSKFYFSKKEGKGANAELYQKFAAQYVAPVATSTSTPSACTPMECTDAEEKEAEAAEKAVTPLKAAPKAAQKAKAAPKEKAAPPPKEAQKEKAAPKEKAATPPKEAQKAAKAAEKAKEAQKDDWLASCPKDDGVYPWEFKGVKYARNHLNHVYSVDEQGDPDAWMGLFNGTKIDTSVAEPEDE